VTAKPGKREGVAVFDPDRPIEEAEADRLGFVKIAEHLAKSISGNAAKKGFVIGIEGRWGSGKSSILNLLNSHLANTKRVTVVRFDPWLIGDRDSMVSSLISDLATAIEAVEASTGSTSAKAKAEARELAKKLREYGATTSRGLSRAAQIGSLVGLPGADTAAKALGLAGDILSGRAAVPLAKQRDGLFKALMRLNHRFVVMIDDLDRLEPAEATEVMRLIRAVGDFPNVIYLLCYDRKILARSLEAALSIDDGSKFLRKVVQASFAVPRPEEFDLRRWLQSELHSLYRTVHGQDIEDSDVRERLSEVCDKEGSLLRTPRDVALVLNALRLTYPPVADKVDYPDMCWLQIHRILDVKLYRWVERYLDLFAVIANGLGMASENEKAFLGRKLLNRLSDPAGYSLGSLFRLSQIVPGVAGAFGRDTKEPQKLILAEVGDNALGLLERSRRLGSPQHYRYYFSLSKPQGALDDEVLFQLIAELNQGKDVLAHLQKLAATPRAHGGTMYGVLLDRLQRASLDKLERDSRRRLLLAIASTVDEAERRQPLGGAFGQRDIWRAARHLLRSYLGEIDAEERKSFVQKLFVQGSSIGWLMESVIGRELFDHGRVGNPRASSDNWLLTPDELDLAILELHKRLSSCDQGNIIDAPDLMSFLYRWKQSGGEKAMREWLANEIADDRRMMILLEKCRGYRLSDRVYRPLNKRDIATIMDFDVMKQRLKSIAENSGWAAGERAKALELLEAAKRGEEPIGGE